LIARFEPESGQPVREASGLALRANKPSAEVDHEVVSLVHAKWQQHGVAATN
jgi:hypothetical protein